MDTTGDVLWAPPSGMRENCNIGRFIDWIERRHGISLPTYDDAYAWSISDIGCFWASLADYYGVSFVDPFDATELTRGEMPGVTWFPGATLNYAENALMRHADPNQVVYTSYSETRPTERLTRRQLRDQVSAVAAGLRDLGVQTGDRVGGYLPTGPEALVALLGAASIGAIWTVCPPEYGARNVIDRFEQVRPVVLFTISGYRYGGRCYDRSAEVAAIRQALADSLRATVWIPYLDGLEQPDGTLAWDELCARTDTAEQFTPVPFDHPLYILYSSGTTGRPKAMVHSHGGMLLEHLKWLGIHDDVGPGDCYYWHTSIGWMAWNMNVSALLCGASFLTYDGALGVPSHDAFWQMVADVGVTHFGIAPGYLVTCMADRIVPKDLAQLRVRSITCGGAPVPADLYEWAYENISPGLYFSASSGGTEVGSAFFGGNRLRPVWSGELPSRFLGCDAHVVDDAGHDLIDAPGELVITQPMPSMLVSFWADDDGSLMRSTYFDKFPGIWRHGDWATITSHGTAIIHGRSDATLNRGGIRLGTSEFYDVVDTVTGIRDSLLVHLEGAPGTMGELLLFVELDDAAELTDETISEINRRLRTERSARHVPDRIRSVPRVPRTTSGKRMEVPVKRILKGAAAEDVASLDAMVDPSALAVFEAMAQASARESRPASPVRAS
jgi:acetoacetyl-CoA synthetase